MSIFKSKITEDIVVKDFLHWTIKAVQDFWPSFYDNFQTITESMVGEKLRIKDEEMASYFLYCSVVASNVVFIGNNYPDKQGCRLVKKVKDEFSPDKDKEALKILDGFIEDFSEKPTNHASPIDSATARLLRLWLADEEFEKICDGKYLSPFILTSIRNITLHYYGGWSRIQKRYKIVE